MCQYDCQNCIKLGQINKKRLDRNQLFIRLSRWEAINTYRNLNDFIKQHILCLLEFKHEILENKNRKHMNNNERYS